VSGENVPNWSNTDFPYMCLRDERRTEVLRDAIERAVSPGDVVVELGGGTGILSFFAARAGASRVLVVEIDPLLAHTLRGSIAANGLGDVVEVIEGDALQVALPDDIDLIISEMIETALLDELQVPAMNRLHRDGIISPATKLIPHAYTTNAQLVTADLDYYGFTILAPKHLWPFYDESSSWTTTGVCAASSVVVVCEDDFVKGPVPTAITETVTFEDVDPGGPNAIRLSGVLHLGPGLELGPTNALNGDKVIPLDRVVVPSDDGTVVMQISFERGGGLGSARFEQVFTSAEAR